MSEACGACLRRSHLIGHLAPRIAGLLDRPRARTPGLLDLGEEDLVEAVAGNGGEDARRFLREFDDRGARRRLRDRGVDVLCRHAARYPHSLLELLDPPAAVYVKGGTQRLARLADGPAATIVGSRRASDYAREVAHGLGRGLCAAGLTVVSGLALGVDGAAHRGALEGGDRAIAVLASGADVAYPRANRRLYDRIASRGVVISELPPGTPAMRWSFPAWNRIMAALGAISVIVEAADPSGSLITAAFAADLGREVGAVPGRVTARMAAGANRLLREGAAVIRGPEDVLDELFGGVRPDTDAHGSSGNGVGAPASLDDTLRRVLDGVEAGHDLEALARGAGLDAGALRVALGRLELLGLVRRHGLGRYERAGGP